MGTYSKLTPKGTRDILFEECAAQRGGPAQALPGLLPAGATTKCSPPGWSFSTCSTSRGQPSPSRRCTSAPTTRAGSWCCGRTPPCPSPGWRPPGCSSGRSPCASTTARRCTATARTFPGETTSAPRWASSSWGHRGLRADLEVIAAGVEALSTCVENFRVEIGHAGVLPGPGRPAGPLSQGEREQLRTTIESKNYAAPLRAAGPPGAHPGGGGHAPAAPGFSAGRRCWPRRSAWCEGDAAQMLEYLQTLYSALGQLGLGGQAHGGLRPGAAATTTTPAWCSPPMWRTRGTRCSWEAGTTSSARSSGRPMPAVGFSIDLDAVGLSPGGGGRPAPQGGGGAGLWGRGPGGAGPGAGGRPDPGRHPVRKRPVFHPGGGPRLRQRGGHPQSASGGGGPQGDPCDERGGTAMKPLRIALTKGRLEKATVRAAGGTSAWTAAACGTRAGG